MPLDLPVMQKENGGIVGKVYKDKRPYTDPISLQCGSDMVYTDAKGSFYLPQTTSGSNLLHIGDLPEGLTTTSPLSIPVEVKRGKNTPFTINLVQAAGVRGEVAFYHPKGERLEKQGYLSRDAGEVPLIKERGLEGVELLLVSEDGLDRVSKKTDEWGRFTISSLRPGSWTLFVSDHGLPRNVLVEKSPLFVHIEAGKTREVEIRVTPKIQRVSWIDSGKISA